MAYKSAYAKIAAAIRAALARTGVNTGGTAGYPRVEPHSFSEGEPQDKDGSYRIITASIESISAVSPDEAAALNTDNLAALADFTYEDNDFTTIGIIPQSLTHTSVTTDGQALYSCVQTIAIHTIQKLS